MKADTITVNTSGAGRRKPLVILTGPTAVGKSALCVKLAKRIGGEIISADSMQVYRRMDIGSAKITPKEMDGVPHHLIDVLDPKEPFHVVRFQQLAKEAISAITARGRIPILAGGTGFYIQAVLYDIDFSKEEEEDGIRAGLEELAHRGQTAQLYAQLCLKDPEAARQIHPNNVKRVIRALEYFERSGTPISAHNEAQRAREAAYDHAYFVLTDERSAIYERIDQRVDVMLEQGLEKEVRQLREEGCTRDLVSMQGLGYKEMLDCLDGECSLEEAVQRIKRDTRHFAKRQLTWFRREREAIWLSRQELPSDAALMDRMIKILEERGIYPYGDRS